jgi:pimeloyl-ACP methyl ester carboxylesterase
MNSRSGWPGTLLSVERPGAGSGHLLLFIFATLISFLIPQFVPSPVLSSESGHFSGKTFYQGKDGPVAEEVSFAVRAPGRNAIVRITNGGHEGRNRCSGAEIYLNGMLILSPRELNQSVSSLERSVHLEPSNLLRVTLQGPPGSSLTVKIEEEDALAAIVRIENSPNPFSPDGNGLFDSTALKATVSVGGYPPDHHRRVLRARWEIGTVSLVSDTDIAGRCGKERKRDHHGAEDDECEDEKTPGKGAKEWELVLSWDGKGSGGAILPDGFYHSRFCVELVNDKEQKKEDGTTRARKRDSDDDDSGEAGAPSCVTLRDVSIDLTPPRVAITGPGEGDIVGTPTIIVSGSVDEPKAAVTINGTPVTPSNGTFQGPVALTYGSNIITVEATDPVANTGRAAVKVIMDNLKPVITLDPLPEYISARALLIKGRVEDLTATTVTLQGKAALLPPGGGSFSLMADLQEGLNPLVVNAADSAGNIATADVRVISDTTPPTVTINAPPNGMITNIKNQKVSGSVTDSSPVISASMNGLPLILASERYEQSYDLAEGPNTVVVRAADIAGNEGSASVAVTLDTVPPSPPALDPLPPVTNVKSITVSGNSEPRSVVKIIGAGEAVADPSGRFAVSVSLSPDAMNTFSAKAVDEAGNESQPVSFSVLQDSVPPSVRGFALKADPQVTLTIPISITFTEEINGSTVNNASITVQCGAGMISGSLSSSGAEAVFVPTGEFPANTSCTLSVGTGITDRAGNNLAPSFTGTFDIIRGPSFLLGEVYDDTLGLPLEGAEARVLQMNNTTVGGDCPGFTGGAVESGLSPCVMLTDSMGRFSFEYLGPAKSTLVEVRKAGYTRVVRDAFLSPNRSSGIFDARLAPVKGQTVSALSGGIVRGDCPYSGPECNGGAASGPSPEPTLAVPPSAFTQDTDISLTTISRQGPGLRLPPGWSPFYGVDISPWGASFNQPATLSIKNIWSITGDSPGSTTPLCSVRNPGQPPSQSGLFPCVVVARFGDDTMGWVAGSASLPGGDIVVEIRSGGQYLLLFPDTLPSPPPVPAAGAPVLPSAGSVPDGTATVAVTPPAVLSLEGAQGITTVVVTSQKPLPSGTPIEVKVSERYDLKDGESIIPEPFTQDITLYARGDCPDLRTQCNGGVESGQSPYTLSARFPTTPSRIYPLGTLSYGKVEMDVHLQGGTGNDVTGSAGGAIASPDGTAIIVPPLSLTKDTLFTISPLAESELPVSGHGSLFFAGGLTLQIDGGAFKSGAYPQFALPGLTAPDGTKVIVATVEAVNGKSELSAAAAARVVGGKIVIERCLATVVPGCVRNGRYAFYVPARPFGFISGNVLKPVLSGVGVSNMPLPGAVVSVDNLPFKSVSDASGNFIVLSLAGSFTVTALEASSSQTASASGTIAAGETVQTVLTLGSVNPRVTGVIPADRALSVDPKAEIRVSFSSPINGATLNSATFMVLQVASVSTAPAAQIPGHLSLSGQGSAAVFVPAADLRPDAAYRVKLTSGITDAFGNPLVPFESVFTTAAVIGNDVLPPGALKAGMPDADGYVTVRGGVGLTYGGATVLIINNTKGIVLTVIANADGSFEGRIRADISDEVVVQVKDLLGNATTLGTGLFQNDDGTAAVGPKGGTIHGPGDITAFIPEKALDNIMAVQVTTLPESAVQNVRMHAELKSAGVFKVETGGIRPNEEIKISVPAPDWITPEHQILIMKVVNIRGFDELTLACPAVLQDGRIVSTSPPFDGVRDGMYEIVSWIDAAKGTAYALIDVWNTYDVGYVMGDYDFIFGVPYQTKKQMVITVPVNRPYNINLQSLSGETVKTVSLQGPPAKGQFVAGVIPVIYDPIPPTVFPPSIPDGARGVLPTEDYITIELSEAVNPTTVNCNPACGTVVVKDSAGNIVEGSVYLAADGKTIVFVPKYGYKYDATYAIQINGVTDWGGNGVSYTSTFITFKPEVIAKLDVPLAMAIDKYKNNLIVKGVDPSLGDITRYSMIQTIDVTDPYSPVPLKSINTYGYIQDIKALPDVTIGGITGDFAVAVGGRSDKEGFLDLLNVTDPSNPIFVGYIYLSWSPSYGAPPPNVPYGGGTPYDVALLDTNAYVANYGLGVQAVDLTQVALPYEDAQANAIGGNAADNSYIAVSKVRNNILAVRNGVLMILDAQTNVIGQFGGLNYPYGVTGVEAFPVDIDYDRNYGVDEDNDGDPTTSAQETFDLAFVTTTDGIVVIDVTNPAAPEQMDFIPIRVARLAVNRERRMAFGLSDGLAAISLKDLRPNQPAMGLIDANGDGVDDRLLYTVPNASGMDLVLSDENGYLLAYVADYSSGKVKVVHLNRPLPRLTILADDESGKTMKGVVTDGTARLKLQAIVPKASIPLYANLAWRLEDPQLPNNSRTNKGKFINSTGDQVDMIDVTFNAAGVAEVVYQAPDTFVRWGTSEEKSDKVRPERRVSVVFSGNNPPRDSIALSPSIRLKRPPVVLVHGLWGCGNNVGCGEGEAYAWKSFEKQFNPESNRLYDVAAVNYHQQGRVLSIADFWVHDRFRKALDKVQENLSEQGFSNAKVDIIAHSMGGLVTRQYCLLNAKDCETKIRRFVTVATPHFGSELADLLLVYRDDNMKFPDQGACKESVEAIINGGKIKLVGSLGFTDFIKVPPHPVGPKKSLDNPSGSAIDDLATGVLPAVTPPIYSQTVKGRWYDFPLLGNTFSAHTIVGLTPPGLPAGYALEIKGLWTFVLDRCGFTPENVFRDSSDRIVGTTSQRGGLGGLTSTLIPNTDHYTVRNSDDTIAKIRLLLNSPAKDGLFSK